MIWTLKQLKSMHREYLAGAFPSTLARRRKRPAAELLDAFTAHGLKLRPRKKYTLPQRRVPDALIHAMHADYMTGMSFADVERKYNRGASTLRDLFKSRGLPVRTPAPNAWRVHRPDGTWDHKAPATEKEITAAIKASTKLIIPASLKLDWRRWDLQKRAKFIARLKAHLNYQRTCPSGPISPGFTPFDYTTPAAWDIVNEANRGLGSTAWVLKMDIKSEGLIYDGLMWFWNAHMGGYMRRGNRTAGEPCWIALHRHVYQTKVGSIPTGFCVRFRDQNKNNLRPSNLYLASKNEACRENQAKALSRKSKERTQALLNKHQQPAPSHVLINSIPLTRKRSA